MTGTYRTSLTSAAAGFLLRAALLALLWWLLAEGRLDAPLLTAALVCAAAGASFALQPPARVRWRAWRVPRLVAHVLWQSLLGGWDVAQRALSPRLNVQPGLSRFELALPEGLPTVLFAWLVSLTPGTASVAIEGRELVVHALDTRMDVEGKLRELQAHVAALFA